MISISQQLQNWRSRYRLSKHEAAKALAITLAVLEAVEQGREELRGPQRHALLDRLSRPPYAGIRGPLPDAGYRPEGS